MIFSCFQVKPARCHEDAVAVAVEQHCDCLQHWDCCCWIQFWTLVLGGGVLVNFDLMNTNRGNSDVCGSCVRKYWKSEQTQNSLSFSIGGFSIISVFFDSVLRIELRNLGIILRWDYRVIGGLIGDLKVKPNIKFSVRTRCQGATRDLSTHKTVSTRKTHCWAGLLWYDLTRKKLLISLVILTKTRDIFDRHYQF
jgi:hypothetical protein